MSVSIDLYKWMQAERYVAAIENFIQLTDTSFPLTEEERKRLLDEPGFELQLEAGVGHEDYIDAVEVFPQVLRRSTFVLVLTVLESDLNDACLSVQQASETPFSVFDLRSRYQPGSRIHIQGQRVQPNAVPELERDSGPTTGPGSLGSQQWPAQKRATRSARRRGREEPSIHSTDR